MQQYFGGVSAKSRRVSYKIKWRGIKCHNLKIILFLNNHSGIQRNSNYGYTEPLFNLTDCTHNHI
jgi:hypothetical protein